MNRRDDGIRYLSVDAPQPGTPREIVPGILWLRLPLPYALDHVNVFLLEDADGWAVFDTGICDEPTLALWPEQVLPALGGKPITRIVVSHFHPDHAGMAGWLHDRFAAPLSMPQAEYLYCRLLQNLPARSRTEEPVFYRAQGLDNDQIARLLNRGKSYLERVSGLPPSYDRLLDGQTIMLGGRSWQVITGGGHAPEQAMLWCAADRIFLAADQVLARISPNVSVFEMEPAADPLRLYLASLAMIRGTVASDARVLPGHNLAFAGLHERIETLTAHHGERCEKLLAACRERPRTTAELVPVLFPRAMDSHQMSFALGETLAHINYLLFDRLRAIPALTDPAIRYQTI